MKIYEFLEDNKGVFSNARLANFLIVGSFAADWVMHIIRDANYDPSFTIVGIVAAIMGIKVAQKKLSE